MAFSHSPRKGVPLATGDEKPPSFKSKSGPSLTRRVFYCGVVVETPEYGRGLHPDVQDLVASLGDPLDLGQGASSLRSNSDDSQTNDGPYQRKRAMTDATALADVINELVTTERSYVKRLRTLKGDYADPLRTFSRSKDTAIIPPYEAKTLFGNIDNLVPVNEAFLEYLEKMMLPDGPETVGGVGDVALKHFRDMKGFENYKQYYSKREEAQAIFEKEMRKASGFAAFIDRIKYSSADAKNRVGLRELLMDPVQRIPRYTLLFRTMIKFMGPDEPQRARLIEADEIASKIAQAETDDHTKRATIMYCLGATIEDFPPALISNSRKFIDCIDVEDVVSDGYSMPGPSTSSAGPLPSNLHCSLVLFDDKLMIVKRPGNGEKGCRVLSGLADMDKLTKSGRTLSMKKSGMVCKGVIDVTDVVVTDIGGPDFHLYLESPPPEQTERWAGRPFRSLSVVVPPSPLNLDPTRTESEKKRFLDNLWATQARYRTRTGQSVVLCADEREVENKGGKMTRATTYFNVYQRTAFLKEPKKTKIVLHIDETGTADPLPFGVHGPPFVVVRVQPMPGDLCRYNVLSNDPNDEGEEDIVQTARIPGRIIQTIHQFGLFKFRTGNVSAPSTPTATIRSRAAIFGLDAISRNLFGALPGTGKGDIFGGSMNSHRKSRTTVSRSSMYTQSTITGDSNLSLFSRTNSMLTAATIMSLMEDEANMSVSSGSRNSKTRSRSLSKKLIKRGKSPGSGSEREASPHRSSSRLSQSAPSSGRSRSPSVEGDYSDYEYEEEDVAAFRDARHMDESERDLVARLELARRNSRNQTETAFPPMENPVEDTIYEEGHPLCLRPGSRASRELPEVPHDAQSQRSTTPRPLSTPPGNLSEPDSPTRESRSRNPSDRRPIGPRCPSPLPPSTPVLGPMPSVPSSELDIALEHTLVNMSNQLSTPHRPDRLVSPIPRSKRQPFEPTGNTDLTPRAFGFCHEETANPPGVVEPLAIKKKNTVRENGSPPQVRRTYTRHSPLVKNSPSSPKRTTVQIKSSRIPIPTHTAADTRHAHDVDKLIRLSEATKEDVESARRAIKRIRLDSEQLRTAPSSPAHDIERPASPVKPLRLVARSTPITKEAQARMDEMRQLIGRRQGDLPFRPRPLGSVADAPRALTPESPLRLPGLAKGIEELASHADHELEKVSKNQDVFQAELKSLGSQLKGKSSELEKTRTELQSSQRQTEVVKELLADCTAEKNILYQAFNEELDGMYNDANLPEAEAWVAMTSDLRETKKQRANLENENSNLKRRLSALEMQNEEWAALLRAHGLIP